MECARFLDKDDIKCGHGDSTPQKVFASCLPDETANDKFYTKCKGVKWHTHSGHSKSIKFSEHQKLYNMTIMSGLLCQAVVRPLFIVNMFLVTDLPCNSAGGRLPLFIISLL